MAHIRRIFINLVLIAGFMTFACLIISPLIAEMQYGAAKESGLAARYNMAIRLDPFNSEYLAGFGKCLYRQSAFREDKSACLTKAKALYNRAIRLNPKNADYPLGLGLVELTMYRDLLAKTEKAGFDCFKAAVQNDPKGFNTSYSIGYAGMAMWNSISPPEKEFILDRLKYSLKIRPRYSKYVYSLVFGKTKDFKYLQRVTPGNLKNQNILYWFIVKNNLWQLRKEQAQVLDIYKQKEARDEFKAEKTEMANRLKEIKSAYEKSAAGTQTILQKDWQGKSKDGKVVYKNGKMFWIGTIGGMVNAPKGGAIVIIQAKGTPVNNIYPYMIVALDDTEIGETFVSSSEWRWYAFKTNTDGGIKVLSVTFVNDGSSKSGEDRNLFIGKAGIVRRR